MNTSTKHFVDLVGFDNYEISIEKPHIIREKSTHYVVDEWYNGYGDAAVMLTEPDSNNEELYLVDELVQKQFQN